MFVCYYALCSTCLHVFSLIQWSSLHYHGFWDNKLPCNYIDENNPWAMGNWQWCYSNKKVSALNSNAYMYVSICKQEPMGHIAHQRNRFKSINTFVESYELIRRGENQSFPFCNLKVLICKTLSPFHQKMLCAKFAWKRPNGWNWPSGSWEEMKMWKVYGQQAISKNLRVQLRWAKRRWGWRLNTNPFPSPVLTPMWLNMHLQLLIFFSRNTGSIWTKLYHGYA